MSVLKVKCLLTRTTLHDDISKTSMQKEIKSLFKVELNWGMKSRELGPDLAYRR